MRNEARLDILCRFDYFFIRIVLNGEQALTANSRATFCDSSYP